MKRVILLCLFVTLGAARADVHFETAEFHWMVCGMMPSEATRRLGLEVDSRASRRLAYFETRDRQLEKKGAHLRYRRTDKKVELTAKLRRDRIEDFDARWLAKNSVKCERDVSLRGVGYACSIEVERRDAAALAAEPIELATAFSERQHEFLLKHGVKIPAGLVVAGPVLNTVVDLEGDDLSFRIEDARVGGRSVLDGWELSTRPDGRNDDAVFDRLTARLERAGLGLCAGQRSKTESVLDRFLGAKVSNFSPVHALFGP